MDGAMTLGEGSFGLALFTAFGLVGALVVERALLRWRWSAYFAVGLPLSRDPVSIPQAPTGAGRTETVHWEVVGPLVRFWADPSDRVAPSGLHGVVLLGGAPGAVTLRIRWSPPWSYVLAMVWLVVLGAARGQLALTGTIGAVLLGGVFASYRMFAVRAAGELRSAFVRS